MASPDDGEDQSARSSISVGVMRKNASAFISLSDHDFTIIGPHEHVHSFALQAK